MDPVSSYFDAERAESLFFIGVGALALAACAWVVVARRPAFFKGMALSLAIVALIQLAVGITVFVRSPQDDARVHAALQADRAHIAAVEVPRMQAVVRNFVLYRWIELTLLLVGAVLVARARRGSAVRGAGLGLALQAALMLALDLVAERRAATYLEFLTAM
jgi:hypothetical protein